MWYVPKSKYLPEATGKYAPGCSDIMLDYGPESLFFRFYYPSNEAKTDKNSKQWFPWTPSGNGYIMGLAKVLMLFPFIIRFLEWWSPGFIPVTYGAKPKLDEKLNPVILSHGLGAHRTLYSNMCCELASRGYLVAALEHKGGSACYTYYYNSWEDAQTDTKSHVEYEPFQWGEHHFTQRKTQIDIRAKECNKALDFLISLDGGKVPKNVLDAVAHRPRTEFELADLVGRLNLECVTMAGHSFGGGTALLALSQRREFKQGILLDPWMFPIKDDNLDVKVQQPLLFINTQTFHITANVNAMAKFLNNQNTMYTILHTTHEHQGDSVLLMGSWLNWFMKKLDPLVALKINNYLILRFLQKHVGGEEISECEEFLEGQGINFAEGLTKPWA